MSREILISYADRLLKIINTPKTDLDELGALLSPDLQTPLTYPNTSSGYEGIKSLITKLHGSLTSFALTVISSAVDEKESRVVYFVKSAGIQTGEWHGVPGTGKPFDHFGFLMMRVNLQKGVIDEVNVLFQDFLFLKQIGVIPYGFA